MTFRRLWLLGTRVTPIVGSLSFACIGTARAAVVEPNGLQVPNLAANTGPGGNGETDLGSFFKQLGESFDVIRDASAQPAVFSPMCDFSAELLLSQSQGLAGVAWYNVPANVTAIPDKVYQILPPSNTVPATGGVISSGDIRNDPRYAGGLIGFVLTDNGGRAGPDGTARIYYSEPSRNDYCSGCTTPGYWVMMLAYKSTLPQYPSSYYLAFEDWLTTSSTSLGQSDCDFNDKVFRVSGIQCQGGGQPCDTGQLGVCKPGLTECTIGMAVVCRPQVPASPERCDNVDNDCDGFVDDGDNLCPNPGDVCEHGNCVRGCSSGEFACPVGLTCAGQFCVETACANVTCGPGLVCRAGKCIDACSGVTCPIGQLCETGVCVDPCKNVNCDSGTVCSNGACIAACNCAGCPAGKACKADGSCVDTGCETQACVAGQVCVQGTCTDACRGATCPGNAACTQGQCGTPPQGTGGSGGVSTTSIVLGASGGNTTSSGRATNGDTGTIDAPTSSGTSGCGCQLPSTPSLRMNLLALAALLLLGRRQTRRQ
jgi:MYXO-CTERM domain-containing protein